MQRKAWQKHPLDVSLSTLTEWEIGEKIKQSFSVCLRRTATRPGCLLEGGRRLARSWKMQEWVISKRARHERVSRKMIRAMVKQIYDTVSDSRDEEFPPPQQLHLQRTHNCWIKRLSQINAWSVKWLKQIHSPAYYLVIYILDAPSYQTHIYTHTITYAHTHMDTDSNVDVNETSDITIPLADMTQAEQTPKLQLQINEDSWATSRPVCKQDGMTVGTANHVRNGRANRGACGWV